MGTVQCVQGCCPGLLSQHQSLLDQAIEGRGDASLRPMASKARNLAPGQGVCRPGENA